MNLLYVEDNPADADLLRRELSRSAPDIQMELATTIADALRRLHAPLPALDLVLTDLGLPDGSGLDLVAQIRAAELDIPVVVVTGSGDEETVVAALHAGALDYQPKQGDYLVQLPATLREALQRHRRQRLRRRRPLRVLYAERSRADIDLAARNLALRAPHISLDAVRDAHELLARLDLDGPAPPCDVLLVDYHLPGMNALEVIKEVHQQRRLDLPILVVTGQGSAETALNALRLGAADYLVKGSDFFVRLPTALENAHLRASLEREQTALQESQERFRQLAEHIDQVFWLSRAHREELLYVSPAYERIWGRGLDALYRDPRQWLDAVHPEDRDRVAQALQRQPAGDAQLEYRVVRPDGTLRFVQEHAFPIRDRDGHVYRVAGFAQDITVRKEQEARIEYLAYHDALTGLANRALVLNRLQLAIAQAQRAGQSLAVLLIDLDRFSAVNDTLGHPAGDRLLQQVGERLKAVLREVDTVGRTGGDEFLVLLPNIAHADHAATVAAKAIAALGEPFHIESQELHIGASIGISVYPRDASDGDTLIQYADTAMYLAKEQSRNTFRFFSPELDARVRGRLRLANELRRAVPGGQLYLVYQPQVDLDSGAIVGAESLVRWNHPERGTVMPGDFIGVAEETGLILSLGEWVLRSACDQAGRWQAAGLPPLRVCVNVSARQLEHGDLVSCLRRILSETGCNPALLEIEITESALMQDPIRATAAMRAVHDLGVSISMDDFGTGYSSLGQLKRFPLDRVKIDGSFVRGLPQDPDDIAIVRTILLLARQLQLEVVGEGVETQAQRDFLRAHGCQAMQGFLFSRALSPDAFEALVRNHLDGRGAMHGAPKAPAL